jgi:hypothetical protein
MASRSGYTAGREVTGGLWVVIEKTGDFGQESSALAPQVYV